MNELNLTNETFALVGQQDRAPQCQDCGERRFLVSGRCEPCTDARAQEFIRNEAMQNTFFCETAEPNHSDLSTPARYSQET